MSRDCSSRSQRLCVRFAVLLLTTTTQLIAAEPTVKDVEFTKVEGHPLTLDIYQANQPEPAPLIVWVHGGAWRAGDKSKMPIGELLGRGFTIASVDYRLSTQARFPAQVHDINAAIRFLKSESQRFQIDPDRVVVAGASAGGHLAALVGVSAGVAELAGPGDSNSLPSSRVQAIVSFYGASNLETILSQSTPHGLSVRVPALNLLLGADSPDRANLARLASPVQHVDGNDPPIWLIHGDQDPQMPINQSHELVGKYRAVGLPVDFDVVYGGKHGGAEFYSSARLSRLAAEILEHFDAPLAPSDN